MENICGIYEIRNVANNKVYIGQSRNVRQRWGCHITELRYNRHHNNHLQKSWNKYGEANFCFSLLDVCEEHKLNELEAKHISLANSMNPDYGYNIRYVDENDVYTYNEEGIKRLSDSHEFQFRQVNQYDDHKNKISCYKSLKEAERETHFDFVGIRNCAVFNGKRERLRKFKDYYWIFNEDCDWFEQCDIQALRDQSKFKVNKYEFPSGKFICQYNSIKDAAQDNGVTTDVISLCVRQAQNHSSGFTYRNSNDYEFGKDITINYQKKPSQNCRPVLCIDAKTGFIIKEYPSIISVEEDGIRSSHVASVCRGKRKTCGGYKWVYKN